MLDLEIRQRHIKRLRKGKCTIELGFILSDIINDFERVSDHCSNIAVAMIELSRDVFDIHAYLNDLKKNNSEGFKEAYSEFDRRFDLDT